MRRVGINIYCQCCRTSPESSGTNSKTVNRRQHFLFKFLHIRNGRPLIHRTRQRFLCKQGTLFKCTANPDANNHRRTGIRSCILNCSKNSILNTFDPVCRLQHKYPAHIFAAKSLRRNGDPYLIPRHKIIMNDRRCIILRILADQWILHYRLTQITIHISLTHPFIDRICQRTAFKMNILADFHKNNCHTRVLADGYGIFLCNPQIILKLSQYLLTDWRLFFCNGTFQCFLHIPCQHMVRFYAHLPDIRNNFLCMYCTHALYFLKGLFDFIHHGIVIGMLFPC